MRLGPAFFGEIARSWGFNGTTQEKTMIESTPLLRKLLLTGLVSLLPCAVVSVQAQSLKNGLTAYWDFENDFKDKAGGPVKFDGTENGSVPIAFVAGKSGFGKAIEMNGEDQFIEITGGEPDDLAFAGASMSIAGWFKVAAFDTSWQALVAKGEGSNWRVHRRGGEAGFAHAGGTGEGPAGGAVDDGNWHHFVAISDVDAVNFGTALYIDGAKYTENASAPNLGANGKRMMIGENPDARNREWEGQLDDIAMWNRVLTEAEIGQLYAGGVGKPLSVLLGAVVADADKDGMPDDYEKEMGFNPNDASDAAKDFDGDGVSNLDEFKAGTDPIDTTKPVIASISSSPTLDTVRITFSEEVDPATATVAANYTLTPSLAVTAVSYSKRVATLTTAAQAAGGTGYTVAVKGVKDMSKNEVAAGTQATFFSYLLTKTGVIQIKVYTGIGGTPVDNLYNDPKYPASPDRTGTLFSFTSRDFLPSDSLDNYGAVMEGHLTPAESGNYRFFIHSDDASQLFLSTDDKEANLGQIAEETGCCNNFTEPDSPRTSEPVALVANRKYFIRLVYKEGGGGDYGRVAWRKEGDKTPASTLQPIGGQFLSSLVDLPAPAEGVFATQTPGPGAKGVSPSAGVIIAHRDGKVAWTAANTSLKIDGAAVTSTFTKAGTLATIEYKPASLWASKSVHTVSLTHPDPAGNPMTMEWTFEVSEYKGPIKDKVAQRPAIILGGANQTDDKGGKSGQAGDRGLDTGVATGVALVPDASFLNAASADDKMSIAFHQKIRAVRDSSAFWALSPGSNNGSRGFQAHAPWSNANIYFDTAGCCDADSQRINAGIDSFADYTGDATWWNSWHHFVFVKDGAEKRIFIDGKLFHSGGGTSPLPTDFTSMVIGGGPGITENRMNGTLDDFAVFDGAVTEAQARSLSGGAAPSSVAGLVAHWDFNEVPAAEAPKISKISLASGNVTIEWTGGGTLQKAASISGPWSDVAGASPKSESASGASGFYRIKQ
jgi:hypothetical protein